jgi:hypothetical protein
MKNLRTGPRRLGAETREREAAVLKEIQALHDLCPDCGLKLVRDG